MKESESPDEQLNPQEKIDEITYRASEMPEFNEVIKNAKGRADAISLQDTNREKSKNKKSIIIWIFLFTIILLVALFIFIIIVRNNKISNNVTNNLTSNINVPKNINNQKTNDKSVFMENGRYFREYRQPNIFAGISRTYGGYNSYADVGGKLAYIAEENNKYFIFFDGKKIGKSLGGVPINIVDSSGEPAYLILANDVSLALAFMGNIYIGEKRVDTQYDHSKDLIEYKDKIAYLGYRLMDQGYGGWFVNYNGKEYGFNYNGEIAELFVLDDRLSFIAMVKEDERTVTPGVVQIIDDKEVELPKDGYNGLYVKNSNNYPEYITEEGRNSEYNYVRDVAMINNKAAAVSYIPKEYKFASPKERSYAFYDGHHYGVELDDVLEVASVNNKIAIMGIKDGKNTIVYNGKFYGKRYDYLYDLLEWKNAIETMTEIVRSGTGIHNIGEVSGKLTYQATLFENGNFKNIIVMEE